MKPPRELAAEIIAMTDKGDRIAALARLSDPLIKGMVERHVRNAFARRAHAKSCLDKVHKL